MKVSCHLYRKGSACAETAVLGSKNQFYTKCLFGYFICKRELSIIVSQKDAF